jgi:hypothetical protein
MTAKTAAKTRVGGLGGEDRHSQHGGGLRSQRHFRAELIPVEPIML